MKAIAFEVLGALDEMDPGTTHELRDQLIRIFMEDTSRRVAKLRADFAVGNRTQVSEGAHAIRSAAANLGAGLLSEACHALQHAAPVTEALVVEVEARFAVARAELEAVLRMPRA